MTIKAKSDEDQKRKAMLKKEPKMEEDASAKDEGAQAEDDEVQADNEAQDVDVAGNDNEPVHEGVVCNECGMQPIVGARYKCQEWDFLRVIGTPSTDDIVSSVALHALITTCAKPARRTVSTPPTIVC